MTMTYAKALRELDLFPELGMDSCQASLVFKSSLPLTLLYNRGKLVSATLMLEDSPKDILPNAVLMNGVLREIPTKHSLMVQGNLASLKRSLNEALEADRMVAFEIMPSFDFWATGAFYPDGNSKFSSAEESRLWLEQVGFRHHPTYLVQGSQGLRRLASSLQDGSIGPLPAYFSRESIALKGVSVHSGVHKVRLPEKS